jgi:hypothetical protein
MRDCLPPWHKPNLGAQIPWPSLSVEDSLDQIEDLSSVSSVDLDITPIPLVISGLSVQFSTNGGVTPARQLTRYCLKVLPPRLHQRLIDRLLSGLQR